MNEEWKVIKGFENYEISNMGRVKLKRGKIYKGFINNCGYYMVCLYKNNYSGNRKLVSRLVAEAFIPNPDNLYSVNHKDENKLNNYVDNLEWMTRADNVRYSCCGKKRQETTEKTRNILKINASKRKRNEKGQFV